MENSTWLHTLLPGVQSRRDARHESREAKGEVAMNILRTSNDFRSFMATRPLREARKRRDFQGFLSPGAVTYIPCSSKEIRESPPACMRMRRNDGISRRIRKGRVRWGERGFVYKKILCRHETAYLLHELADVHEELVVRLGLGRAASPAPPSPRPASADIRLRRSSVIRSSISAGSSRSSLRVPDAPRSIAG